jgi:oligoribonuclease
MSGLNYDDDRILEVGAIVTNKEFKELGSFHRIVFQSESVLNGMGSWCQKHHGASGLTEAVKKEGLPQEQVEAELLDWMNQYFKSKDQAILCGNSIATDREFIRRYMPKIYNRLHYRILDVSSWKIIFKEIYDKRFQKSEAHRAIEDIRQSIAELQYYMSFIELK